MNFSERSPIERINIVTPTVTGIPPGAKKVPMTVFKKLLDLDYICSRGTREGMVFLLLLLKKVFL